MTHDAKHPNYVAGAVDLYGHRLRTALQPIYAYKAGTIQLHGTEALARLAKDGTPVAISDFLEDLDDDQRFHVETMTMLRHLKNFRAAPTQSDFLFLNADPRIAHRLAELNQAFDFFTSYARKIEIDPSRIVIELTEQRASSDAALAIGCQALKEAGLKLAIDDFGAAFSNTLRVQNLKPDYVKLDRIWFQRMLETPRLHGVITQTIKQFKDQGSLIVAEGIETLEMAEFAIEIGADLLQGYYFAVPKMCAIYKPEIRMDLDLSTVSPKRFRSVG